jgi:hypothetical protein
MLIGHYKETNIASAPEAINEIINKYTDSTSYVFGYGYKGKYILPKTDLIHQHNRNTITHDNKIIQYHSEPFRVDLTSNIQKLVIAQYHATLKEYSDCTIVRNPIDLYNELFIPKYQDKIIRIGYSPSNTTTLSDWGDKGFFETEPILKSIKNKFGDYVEIDIITNAPLKECLYRKSLCNIFIDEVKTTSYHRSGLESLAMGIATICSVGNEVETVLLKSSGAPNNPFINVFHDSLEEKLTELIYSGLENILKIGFDSRVWMQKFWDPKIIAEEYISIYKKNIHGE